MEADPSDPSKLAGFDVEIAEMIAADLGLKPQFVQITFTSLDQSAHRKDFDIGLSGVEDTPARRAMLGVSVPYYEFKEVLTVRAADASRFPSLDQLRGRRIGTLGGTIAYELLLAAEKTHGITAISYDDDVHPYTDLAAGRLDGVVLDHVLAERAMRRTPGLVTQPAVLARGHYVIITSPDNRDLLRKVDAILLAAMGDGRLERIFRKWNVWNEDQPALYTRVRDTLKFSLQAVEYTPQPSQWDAVRRYIPALLRAAGITLVLSCGAMVLAVLLGSLIAIGRVYGAAPVRAALLTYVEVVRGTPLLLQLFVLYYGLASIVLLPAFLAALIGLALNYAAYESEIYRGALEAVPRGQLEAARVLGFREWQILRLIRAPQAFRFALAPMTNDFVALLKDSSLVSVLTVMELTKQTQIFATNIGSWVVPGLLCAGLYLAMSLPLAHLARRLELRWKAGSL